MRIAIIGTGISGLAAAHWLHPRHEITVYEADDRIGGHTNTVDVISDGQPLAIDTGFIVYNDTTYPLFSDLLRGLGVATRPSDMSFGVACGETGLEWASANLGTLFAQRRNLFRGSFWRMLGEIRRFNREAAELLVPGTDKVTLGDFVCGGGYSADFTNHYLVPMGAAIWSANARDFLDHPAATVARFFQNHGLLERGSNVRWRVVDGGSRRYVDALTAPFRHRIRTGSPVERIGRDADGVRVTARGETSRFDRAIVAVHSDQALAMLEQPSDAEFRTLGAIRYQANEALLHTDVGVMPTCRRAWASWNGRTHPDPEQPVFVSYHMNRLQGLPGPTDFFVTLNGASRIDPNQVVARFSYDHPVFDSAAVTAQQLHPVIDGLGGVHYVGAYWGHGFHEDGVRSARDVCRKLGAA